MMTDRSKMRSTSPIGGFGTNSPTNFEDSVYKANRFLGR